MLGVGTDWIYAQARAGRIPHIKLGRNTRFRRESIDAWIADQERATMHRTKRRGDGWNPSPGMAQEESPS